MRKTMQILAWLAWGALLAAIGCAAGYYAEPGPAPYPGSYISDVPPSFYGNDPALSHWYTAPYWDPERP